MLDGHADAAEDAEVEAHLSKYNMPCAFKRPPPRTRATRKHPSHDRAAPREPRTLTNPNAP